MIHALATTALTMIVICMSLVIETIRVGRASRDL
jgi:hypothetical protein